MNANVRLIAYIGSPVSFFSKQFIPVLKNIPGTQCLFICILQKEFSIKPKQADLIFKLIHSIKKFKSFIEDWSCILYWSVYCNQNQLNFKIFRDVNDLQIIKLLKDCEFVLTAGIRKKISRDVISSSKNGIINYHYSLLPKYRGTHPIFWQKIRGDLNFGYSFHFLTDKLDAGEIVYQQKLALPTEIISKWTVSQIANALIRHAANQVYRISAGSIQSIPQQENDAIGFKTREYFQYINLNTRQSGKDWRKKCSACNVFIFQNRWLLHLENSNYTAQNSSGYKFPYICKDGIYFKIKKINYLPPVFYYFAMKRYFE